MPGTVQCLDELAGHRHCLASLVPDSNHLSHLVDIEDCQVVSHGQELAHLKLTQVPLLAALELLCDLAGLRLIFLADLLLGDSFGCLFRCS